MESLQLITEKEKDLVSSYFLNITDILNSTGLYNFLRESDLFQKGKRELADFLVGFVERNQNQRFHESLNLFEKFGFLSNQKWQDHQRRVGLLKGMASFSANTILDLGPLLFDYFYQQQSAKKKIEFLIGWLAYINQRNSVLIQKRVIQFCNALKTEFNAKRYRELFEEYSLQSTPVFPVLENADENAKFQIFQIILSVSDLEKSTVKKRANDLGNFLELSESEILNALSNTTDNQKFISDISKFSGFSINTILQDLAKNIEHAKQCGIYTFENDPYFEERKRNKEILLEVGKMTPMLFGGLSFFTGEIGDFLLISSLPIINKLLNSEINIDKTIEISKRLKGFGKK